MSYIEGFVGPVPTANKDTYLAHAKIFDTVFKDHGATRIVECWGADVPDGKLTSFPMAVKLEPDETVVFGWIEWPSKAARDAGGAAAMKDPRMAAIEKMPFDGKRMIYGGFEVINEV
jgi:uncharacterized protein YbaA (DUF1428 family)